jgi:hypothetical protein
MAAGQYEPAGQLSAAEALCGQYLPAGQPTGAVDPAGQ